MKNILVPTDFSPEAHHAYAVALQVARQTSGTVTLLHVLEPLPMPPAGFGGVAGLLGGVAAPVAASGTALLTIKELMDDARHRLLGLRQESAGLAPGVWVQGLVEVGRVAEGVLAAAQQLGTDLVVVGARPPGAPEEIFTDSTAGQLRRQAPCPVLTVAHAHPRFAVHNIVLASDFAANSATAADGFRDVAAAFPTAMVHLLRLAPDHDGQAAGQRLEEFAERAQLPNYAIVLDRAGIPGSPGIEQFARQVQADLVVIPTHARSGPGRLFRPGGAEAGAAPALPPVLTYRA